MDEYVRLADALPEVDVRAHSLTSQFADIELRKQWEEVRDRFLALHEEVNGAAGLRTIDIADNKAALGSRKQLADAAKTVRQTSYAEANIDRLFRVERGDVAARQADVTRFRGDIADAVAAIRDPEGAVTASDGDAAELLRDLETLDARVAALEPSAPDFIDRMVILIGDYQRLLEAVKSQMEKVKERQQLETPKLYEEHFWYPNAFAYVHINSWHTANVEAAAAAASASSSSGFSAAGGSSSF